MPKYRQRHSYAKSRPEYWGFLLLEWSEKEEMFDDQDGEMIYTNASRISTVAMSARKHLGHERCQVWFRSNVSWAVRSMRMFCPLKTKQSAKYSI